MKGNIQLKLVTKKDFPSVKNKYKEISPSAQEIIDSSTNDLDVLALYVQEGSDYSVVDAKIINEENEHVFLDLLKEGVN